MISLLPRTVRVRLTLWYVSVLAATLILTGAATYGVLVQALRSHVDHLAIEEIETVDSLVFVRPDGTLAMRDDFNRPESGDRIESYLEIRSPDGKVLFRNDRLGNRSVREAPLPGEGVGGYSERSAKLSDGTRVRLASRLYTLDRHPLLIRLAHNEEPMLSDLQQFLLASLLVLPLGLAIAGLAGYSLARRALSPIDQMVRRAEQITPDRLSERLPNREVDDELGRLARVFNRTLDRLEGAFDQLRRFTSDCSHELRTPLAMIRSVGEVGLQKNGTREEYRETVGSMLEEVNRLTALVDALLLVSRADSGSLRLHRSVVTVMSVVREAASLFEVLVEAKSLRLEVDGDETLKVEGDSLFLRQAVANLIDNAVKYSPVGGTLAVRVRSGDANHVTIEVQDHGPGIPPEDRARVFERFYRVDKSRHRESGGVGLGLAIAKWAVEAHGGTIALSSTNGTGCTFLISLPRTIH